jgi:sterol 3beta-glucosyltransferase
MKIGLQTWGSEGDVQPFLALASGLVKAGHQVVLVVTEVSHRDYSHVAEQNGFELRLAPNPRLPSLDMIEKMRQAFKALRDPVKQLKIINDHFFSPAEGVMFDAALQLARECDLLVRHIFCYPTQVAGELAGVPVSTLYAVHNILPSKHLAPFGAVNLGAWAIPLWWKVAQWFINRTFIQQINRLRLAQGLKPVRDVLTQAWANAQLNLIAVSPTVCPIPIDWPKHYQVCGFLTLSEAEQGDTLSQETQDFLELGEPPLYFTFGSMLTPDEASWREVFDLWLSTVQRLGCRAIFQLPIQEDEVLETPDTILVIRRAPHRLIFPQCRGIIHHGGAGTTQASLLAGVPSVVVAHIADQPFWGHELERMGVGSRPMSRLRVTSARLADRIQSVLRDPQIKEKAQAISLQMRQEHGVDEAIRCLMKLKDEAKERN